ncbi:MAG: Tetratricopeptide repeat protein [Chloroflexi bacterium ADurb.Bin325]|nr:MAG: Tetratricopeptide repeat protein [Chloroflexi bacterium ADurb.Bin325]
MPQARGLRAAALLSALVFILTKLLLLPHNLAALQYLTIVVSPDATSTTLTMLPPAHARSDLLLAKLALQEGRYDSALAAVLPAAQQGDRLAGRLAGEVYWSLGQDNEAAAVWGQYSDLDSLSNAGEAKLAANQPEQALTYLQMASQIDDERVALSLASSLNASGKIDEAEAVLENALGRHQRSPRRTSWFYQLVSIQRDKEDWSGAKSTIASWQSEFPSDMNALIQEGWLHYDRDGNPEGAMRVFQQVINTASQDSIGYLNMAHLRSLQNQFLDAESYYALAASLDAQIPQSWMLERANNLVAAGELDRALGLFADMLQKYPSFAYGYYAQAWAYHLSGQPIKALEAMETALQTMNAKQWHYLRAGRIAEEAGEHEKATAFYEKALSIDPENSEVQAALQRVAENTP